MKIEPVSFPTSEVVTAVIGCAFSAVLALTTLPLAWGINAAIWALLAAAWSLTWWKLERMRKRAQAEIDALPTIRPLFADLTPEQSRKFAGDMRVLLKQDEREVGSR